MWLLMECCYSIFYKINIWKDCLNFYSANWPNNGQVNYLIMEFRLNSNNNILWLNEIASDRLGNSLMETKVLLRVFNVHALLIHNKISLTIIQLIH